MDRFLLEQFRGLPDRFREGKGRDPAFQLRAVVWCREWFLSVQLAHRRGTSNGLIHRRREGTRRAERVAWLLVPARREGTRRITRLY
jgi:hypothetical protein